MNAFWSRWQFKNKISVSIIHPFTWGLVYAEMMKNGIWEGFKHKRNLRGNVIAAKTWCRRGAGWRFVPCLNTRRPPRRAGVIWRPIRDVTRQAPRAWVSAVYTRVSLLCQTGLKVSRDGSWGVSSKVWVVCTAVKREPTPSPPPPTLVIRHPVVADQEDVTAMVLLLRLLIRTLVFVAETIVAILTGGVYRRRFLIGELPVQRNRYSRRLLPSQRHASLRLPERRPGTSSPSEEDNGHYTRSSRWSAKDGSVVPVVTEPTKTLLPVWISCLRCLLLSTVFV